MRNPLDFFLWSDIERRMLKSGPVKQKETVAAYKNRLRKVAMPTSKALIQKAMDSMRKRIAAIYAARGNHINFD
jgi:hypothetical protein